MILVALIIVIGFLSGAYPSIFISGFKISDAIKINQLPRSSLSLSRRVLIVFQFIITIFMIISSIAIYQQLQYFRTMDLGFDKKNVIAVYTYGDLADAFASKREFLYNELTAHPGIVRAGATSNLMGHIQSVEFLLPDGKEYDKNHQKVMRFFRSDEGFIPTMDIQLISGRNFDPVKDSAAAFIINETAARYLELDDPVGTMATNTAFGTRGEIVGVMKDINFASLHQKIEPLVLTYDLSRAYIILLKIKEDQVQEALGYIEKTIHNIAPGNLFHYDFIDENLNELYFSEDKLSLIFKIFSILAILISCMGLYAIAAYTAELKTREIGIRKAFGASVLKVFFMFSTIQ